MAKTLKKHPFHRDWRRDLLLAALVSMLLAIALLLYTFGLTSDFIFRVFNAFLIIFILVAGSGFVIIPGVNWVFGTTYRRKGAARPVAAPKRNLPRNRPRST